MRWWAAGGRLLSARGHVLLILFWLLIVAFVVFQLLTEDDDFTSEWIWLGIAVTNLVVLLFSYREVLRRGRERARVAGD